MQVRVAQTYRMYGMFEHGELQRVNRDVSRNPEVVLGTRFGGFCEWYLRFNCPKHVLGAAQDRLDSVCLSVILFNFFSDVFSTSLNKNSFVISEK